jgi:hypothetical protein
LAGLISMAFVSSTGASRWPDFSASCSMIRMFSSASVSRPCMISQRGLSGRWRRRFQISAPITGPIRKPIRQPMFSSTWFSRMKVPRVPRMAPPQ